MKNRINIKINDKECQYNIGITLKEISNDFAKDFKYPILAGILNNEVVRLDKKVEKDSTLKFLDCLSNLGTRIYQNGLIFLLNVVIKELYGDDKEIKVCHSIDKGKRIKTNFLITQEELDNIKIKMQELINKSLPFEKCLVTKKDAIKYFNNIKETSKVKSLNYYIHEHIILYKLNNYYNCFYSVLPLDTSYLKDFDFCYLDENNFILQFINQYLEVLPPYVSRDKILNAYNENYKHAKKLDINYAYDINKAVADNRIGDIIKLDEIVHNDSILEMAKIIDSKKDKIKLVLIAGPSSSGKTTTAKKLSMFLRSLGLNPKMLSVDNYFVDRKDTPKLSNGDYDFESIKAIDIKLFNEQLTKLLNHEEVSLPTFNFHNGNKEYLGNTLKLEEKDILIIEGLHCLNEELTQLVPRENKYKVYVSFLTDLNIDNHNMIPTTDIRLLRRIIRDNRTRGYTVTNTIKTWPLVRSGEEKYIFPYQNEADFVYNTALIYEIGVLKLFVEPLLYEYPADTEYYEEVKRLLEFLRMFLVVPTDAIPNDSLLREFIGNSYFD